VILQPDRVLLDRAVFVELEMVVVVVGDTLVIVGEILAIDMIGKRMPAFVLFVVGIRHQVCSRGLSPRCAANRLAAGQRPIRMWAPARKLRE
jgi:hypothetical protein